MERPAFIARERELAQLDAFLERALAAQGQICFVILDRDGKERR